MEKNELVKTKQIQGSPLMLVTMNDKHFVAMGIERISRDFASEAEAEAWAVPTNWECQVAVACACAARVYDIKETSKK